MMTNPIWVVKTRVFGTAKNDSAAYKGLWGIFPFLSSPGLNIDVIDGLRSIYRTEGFRGLYKGSLLALVGVSNGSIQFAAYEEIKRRRADIKRRRYEKLGRTWRVEDEKLVSRRVSSPFLDVSVVGGEGSDEGREERGEGGEGSADGV